MHAINTAINMKDDANSASMLTEAAMTAIRPTMDTASTAFAGSPSPMMHTETAAAR
jgi:hypothetical protein